MLVGALPWDENARACRAHSGRAHSAQFGAISRDAPPPSSSLQVPTATSAARTSAFFPQRPAEHPFIVDRFGHLKKHPRGAAAARPKLRPEVEQLLMNHDWFWAITGVHQGGGMDTTMIIRKLPECPAIDAAPPGVALAPAASVEAGGGGGGGGGGRGAEARPGRVARGAAARRSYCTRNSRSSRSRCAPRPPAAALAALCDGDGDGGDGDGPRPRKALRGPWWLWALLLGAPVFNYVQARQVDALRTKGAASSR